MKSTRAKTAQRPILVTGLPSLVAVNLMRKVLEDPASHLLVLVSDEEHERLDEFKRSLPRAASARVEALLGDVSAIDLGLSGVEVKRIFDEVVEIYHVAASDFVEVPRQRTSAVNIEGTRNLLEVAHETRRLQRLHYFSTAFVAGRREGVVLESELSGDHGFNNLREQTRYRAEELVRRASGQIPVTIYRPSNVVGDSRTGEIDRFGGPYYYMVAIVTSPLEIPLPLPGHADAPLNLVPIDYLVEAAYRIGRDPRSDGRTFHVVDPQPLSVRRVFELVAQRAEKPVPRGVIPGGRVLWSVVDRFLDRLPALERVVSTPRNAVDQFHHRAQFDTTNTDELLAGSGIVCPRFETYVDNLISYIRSTDAERKKQKEEPAYDPLY